MTAIFVVGPMTLLSIALGIGLFAAWITHLYVCFKAEEWGFLIVGALFSPVAVIHGIGVWFGAS